MQAVPATAMMHPRRRRPACAVATVVAGALLTAALARGPVYAAPTFGKGTLAIVQGQTRVTINVEIAATPESRELGLMNRPSLPDNAGMLFVFESTEKWGFWMKNTLIPLSVAFIDEHWEIVDIQDMRVAPNPQTGPFEIYDPTQPCRYALEVNQGFFARRGLGIGARIIATFK